MVSKQKILIVDDDNNIAELISLYLTKECFETKIVRQILTGFYHDKSFSYSAFTISFTRFAQ